MAQGLLWPHTLKVLSRPAAGKEGHTLGLADLLRAYLVKQKCQEPFQELSCHLQVLKVGKAVGSCDLVNPSLKVKMRRIPGCFQLGIRGAALHAQPS